MMKRLTSGLSKKSLHVFQKFISPDYNKTQKKTNCVSHPNGPIKIIVTFLATLALGVRVVGL